MSDVAVRPLPRPTLLSAPFWDACRRHQLTVQRCSACGTHVFVPRPFCPHCLGTDLQWVASTGEGAIVTYTVVWRAQTPAFTAPYVVAVVRLSEGFEMMTNIVGCAPQQVAIGAAVRVHFVDESDEISLPCFELSNGASRP